MEAACVNPASLGGGSGAAHAYQVCLAILLFDRGISGKIAGQEIRSLRTGSTSKEVPAV